MMYWAAEVALHPQSSTGSVWEGGCVCGGRVCVVGGRARVVGGRAEVEVCVGFGDSGVSGAEERGRGRW
eukprot:797222-Rhodomonas_salina.1